MTDIPNAPSFTVDSVRRSCGGGSVTVRVRWLQPQNIDIDRYDISATLTSGEQNLTTACGQCTSTMITVSENLNNVQMNTDVTITVAAVNLCGETGPSATASYNLSKLLALLYHAYLHALIKP